MSVISPAPVTPEPVASPPESANPGSSPEPDKPDLTATTVSRTMLLTLAGICPVCRRGRMFKSFYTMHDHCPACGTALQRDRGEVTGGMAINMVISSILGVAIAVYCAFFTDLSPVAAVGLMIGAILGFGLLFHRPARSVWVGCLYLTGALHERWR